MWMKVDDGLHAHRKTRAVTKSHQTKTRDAAPMGLWVLAGSWAALHGTDGWVPEDELDRWDDDWRDLTARLVRAGYWWPADRDGEPGYGFTDWHDYNDPADMASKAGTFGNHVRWHVNEHKVDPECAHCPKEPDETDDSGQVIGGRSGGESHPISGGESHSASGAIALPEPEPEPEPDPPRRQASADTSANRPDITTLDRFQEFWDAYGKKVKRADAERRWAKAIKKADPGRIIAAAAAYVAYERANNQGGRFIADPSTWLHGERWRDERTDLPAPQTRVQEHLSLVQQLAAEEAAAEQPTLPQIGYRR